MHIATVVAFDRRLMPAVSELREAVWAKAREWVDVVKIGRTHLQDATPLTVGQEWSGYAIQLDDALALVSHSIQRLYRLAIGGTAVGTGLNAPEGFGDKVAAKLAGFLHHPFVSAPNKFAALASLDAMVAASASLRSLAIVLMKIANDMRWLASGPRAGLNELVLPSNQPGSSIMPGKVNPTQQEAMLMVCTQVIGEDTAVAFAGAQGNFELNTMRQMVIRNVLHCARILGDACVQFRKFSVEEVTLNREQIAEDIRNSLMLVTALSPLVGYDNAAKIAHLAHEQKISLRDAAVGGGFITAEEFDRAVDPRKMVGDPRRDLGIRSSVEDRIRPAPPQSLSFLTVHIIPALRIRCCYQGSTSLDFRIAGRLVREDVSCILLINMVLQATVASDQSLAGRAEANSLESWVIRKAGWFALAMTGAAFALRVY